MIFPKDRLPLDRIMRKGPLSVGVTPPGGGNFSQQGFNPSDKGCGPLAQVKDGQFRRF
jgi:hypothetical protein